MATLPATIYALSQERTARIAFRLQNEGGGYREVSWGIYAERSLCLSAYLASKGIGVGDKVLLAAENCPEWTMIALAVMNLGAILVPVASIASSVEIENILKGAEPKFCFVSEHCAAARQIEGRLKQEYPHSVFLNFQKSDPLGSLLQGFSPSAINSSLDENAVALLIYTSGTTGHPKAVPISHKNILTNARDVLKVTETSPEDRVVSVLPLSHMLEFTGGFVVATLAGATVTYVKSLKAEDLLQAMQNSKATIMIAVPLLFEIIARNLQSKISDAPALIQKLFSYFTKITLAYPSLGSLLFFPIHKAMGGHIRYFVAGGSKLQPATFDFYRSIGITILQGYGLTETSPVLTITSLSTAAPDHVGRALPSIELGIFNDAGEKQKIGDEGEIWGKGPSIFKGYLNPEHTKGVFFKEWFRTGDLGTIDENGFLRITGRKKDIIVTPAGKNVYPEEIETTILNSGLFLEACVLGIQDGAGHEKICLVLVPDKAKFLGKGQEEIIKESNQIAMELCRSLSEYKWPQKIEVLFQELPKTLTRKIKKHEVKKILVERVSKAPSSDAEGGDFLDLSDPLEDTIANSIANITKIDPKKIRITDSLTKDLGLDSLTFVELISSVEKKFQTQIEGVDFTNILTVQDLVTSLGFAANAKKRKAFFKVFFVDFSAGDNTRIFWKIPRRFFNVFLRVYLKLRHQIVVEGLENIPANGTYVFTPNHSSHFDLLSIAGSVHSSMLHRVFAVAAKDYFFNKTWKAFLARIVANAMPFDRKGRVDESMARCRTALDEGGSLTIFPEGTRSPDGRLQAFKPGVGQLLAGNRKAQAVPVFISGAHEIFPKGAKFPGPGKLLIRYGKPISFGDLPANAESYRKIAEKLRAEVVALSYQGVNGARVP